jgi:signal transduction histidine kinase
MASSPVEAWTNVVPGTARRQATIMSRMTLLSSTTKIEDISATLRPRSRRVKAPALQEMPFRKEADPGALTHCGATLRCAVLESALASCAAPVCRSAVGRSPRSPQISQFLSTAKNPGAQPAREGDRGVVWVIDDSPVEAEVVSRLLSTQHDVQTFSDAPRVLELLASGTRPDVIVLDWHMPEVSGLELCRFIRQRYDPASFPILILTATGGPADIVDGLRAGANDFVVKAADSEELRARMLTLVRVRALYERVRRAELAAQRARQSAEDANRAKDAFMATVSHELRTPLNSILGWAHLLKVNPPDEATLRRGLETIERNAKIQVQLIEDILDTARVMSGKLHVELEPVDFAEVVRAAVESQKPAADAKGVRLECSFRASHSTVNGDADRLQQAVWNLISNATKFTPEGGFIRVELTSAPSEVELSVTDSGKGITADFLPHVFDRFRQQDSTATQRVSGLGLGLALVRHLVLAHGGEVTAHSDGDGKGASFRIRLPLEKSRVARRSENEYLTPLPPVSSREMSIGKLANMRVLVVEDDEDARDLLVATLSQEGAHVVSAGSVHEALAKLDVARPDVLLSDIGLPGADGFELIRRVRERHAPESLPAIAFTAYSQAEDRAQARKAGFQAHVSKPASPAEVVRLVSEVARVRADGAMS